MKQIESIKLFSLVVPAYKQEKTISENIKHIQKYLSRLPFPYELIVVVDGLKDNTFAYAKKLESKHVEVYGYPKNLGKGYAVKYGMLKATGDVIGFMDAGMDLYIGSIAKLLEYMAFHNADIIIGSKLHPDSVVDYPLQRRIMSTGYRIVTRMLFGFKVRDSQVGPKIFKRNVVRDVFPRLLVKRFAFDIEMLAVAYARGYRKIYEAPVTLKFNWGSTISNTVSLNFWSVIFSMLWDTAAVFYRLKILHYYDRKKKSDASDKHESMNKAYSYK